MDPQPPVNKNQYLFVMVGVLVVFVVIIGFLFLNQSKKTIVQNTNQNMVETTPVPTKIVNRGSLMLVTYMPSVKVGEQLVMTVVGESEKQLVTGFDTLVSYDTSAFDFVEGKSKLDNFSLYTFKRSSHITITAVKALQSTTPTMFSQLPVMTLTFMPKKAGSYAFSVKSQIGKETTQIVTDQSEKLNPGESTVTVKVD